MAKDLSKVLANRRNYSEVAMEKYIPTAENRILDREMDAQFQMNTIVGEIVEIDMSRLRPYAKHPFKPHSEEKITALAKSIKRDGLQQPIIVRSVDGVKGYEILAGHNRVAAVKRLGKRDISAIIRDVDDDKAALVVVKTNLEQREKLLPSEKAFAYRLQMEALHRDETQIIKNADSSSDTNGLRFWVQNEPRGKTREGLADAVGVSDSEIQRYIRLTYLSPELLEALDEEKYPVMAGYEVSFLDTSAQEVVCHYFFVENTADKLSVKSAELIRVAFQDGKAITSDSIFALLHKPKPKPGPRVNKYPDKKLKRFLLPDDFEFESFVASFPFCSFELFDSDGILLGQNMYNASVAMLDIFDARKYSNANMCILGTSGAGKTYLLQLLALRHRCQGTQVFIIAPLKGHEFRPACEAIGGKYIKLSPASQECVNIMEIRQRAAAPNGDCGRRTRDDSILADKIQKLHIFFTLIKPNITYEERHFLDNALVETYCRFGITHENSSLYTPSCELKPMPCLADLYAVLEGNPDTRILAQVLSRFVTGSAKRLGGQTKVDLSNKCIVLDISEMSSELLPMGMFLALDFVWDEVKRNRVSKNVVFLDELWNLIGAASNSLAAKYVLEIFKTIRGLGGAVVGATQDLRDFFALDNGDYGKGILGNSRIKLVMQMEDDEAECVRKYLSLSDEETAQVVRFKKGQELLCSSFVRTCISFSSSMEEYELISTDRSSVAARGGT